MTYRSCMMPTVDFENPPPPSSSLAGSATNESSNNCVQQLSRLLMMAPNRLPAPLEVKPSSYNGCNLNEESEDRWSAVSGSVPGKSLIAATSCSLQSSDESQQRYVADGQLPQVEDDVLSRSSHSYSGARPDLCVLQKKKKKSSDDDGWREEEDETGCSGSAVDGATSTYSASDPTQNQSCRVEGLAVLHGHHFTGGHTLRQEANKSQDVESKDGFACRQLPSFTLQQSIDDSFCRDEIVDCSVEGFSMKLSSDQLATPTAAAAAAGEYCSLIQSSPSHNNASINLPNQLTLTKHAVADCLEKSHTAIEGSGLELCPTSTQSSSGVISSAHLSSPSVKSNGRSRCPESSASVTNLPRSNIAGHSLDQESFHKAMTAVLYSKAPRSICLVEKSRPLDFEEEEEEKSRRTEGHDRDEKQSLINTANDSRCHLIERNISSSVAEDRGSSHLTASDLDDLSVREELTDGRQKSAVDDRIVSGALLLRRPQSRHRRWSTLAAAAGLSSTNSCHASLEIGFQVDGCNNGGGEEGGGVGGGDSMEDQSTGSSPPLDHPPLLPPAAPLPGSLENVSKEAVEASAVTSAAAAGVISRSLPCSSPAITKNGETKESDECRRLELASGEERGRGKRKRKEVVSYSHCFLEMMTSSSSSDDEDGANNRRKCVKTSHTPMKSTDETNNGQRRKAVPFAAAADSAAALFRCRSNDAVVSAADSDRRSLSDVGNASTDIKSHHLVQGTSASTVSPTASGQMLSSRDEQKAKCSSLCRAVVPDGGSRKKISEAADLKEEESVDDKVDQQQQQQRGGREKELELEVTNENGEVEIVTIVDLHSSSDEADLLAMNGEDEICIPLTDNDSDDNSASSDCEEDRQPPPHVSAAATEAEAAAWSNKMQPMQRTESSPLSQTSCVRLGVNRTHSAAVSHKTDDKRHNDLPDVAGPSHETKTSGTDRTAAAAASRKQPLRKKRKRVMRGTGDDFSEFGSDVEDNDKVHRLKKMYGISQKPTKPVKTSQVQTSAATAAADKNASSSSGSLLGPYIRLIGGSKETPLVHPVSCKVVNVKNVDLDAPHRKSKKTLLLPESSCVPSSLKFVDSVPWICLFCGHGSAYSMLGDLYGPYYPQSTVKSDGNCELKPKTVHSEKQSPTNTKSAADKVLRGSPRRLSSRLRTISCDSLHEGSSGNLPQELWVHEQCAVWTSGVYVARGKLQGLEEAAVVAAQVVCSSCHRTGATLGCYVKGCSQNYHYLCAVKAGCFFQEENFSVLCPKHRDKGRKSKSGQSE